MGPCAAVAAGKKITEFLLKGRRRFLNRPIAEVALGTFGTGRQGSPSGVPDAARPGVDDLANLARIIHQG